MNVSLTPRLEKFVQAKVEDGRYNAPTPQIPATTTECMSEYALARAAERHMEQIRDYVASDDVAVADRLIESFFEN